MMINNNEEDDDFVDNDVDHKETLQAAAIAGGLELESSWEDLLILLFDFLDNNNNNNCC